MPEKTMQGQLTSWKLDEGVLELELHGEPCNEIGTAMLAELESFVGTMDEVESQARGLLISSRMPSGFCAGADLRELYQGMQEHGKADRLAGVRDFLVRIHAVMNAIDAWPHPTVAAVHGVCFGGGLELMLTCDVRIADRMARFCFPELRLGLIPGFGGIPRLNRDIGNAVVRDLLMTGRSMNATRAHSVGLVNQVVSEGKALDIARSTLEQMKKFDSQTMQVAKKFIKPIPKQELQHEIDLFCELMMRPAVDSGLRKFVESTDQHPYLP